MPFTWKAIICCRILSKGRLCEYSYIKSLRVSHCIIELSRAEFIESNRGKSFEKLVSAKSFYSFFIADFMVDVIRA